MTEPSATILYVDDDEGLRRLTRRALERRGYSVHTAASGDEGVAAAVERSFDLVAVDHHMPGKDGLQTLAALHKLMSAPPVIYVTGSDDSRLAVAALKAGAIDYVVKTADANYFDLLGQTIDQALETVRLRRAHAYSEAQLRDTNARLESLLYEVNHRVANSLQLVAALVGMQARLVTDEAARAALADTERRVAAIGQVHKHLYTSHSVTEVNMADYLKALIASLSETWSSASATRKIRLESDDLHLPTDQAVAMGVVVNELVTNSCKYAYSDGESGEVRVNLRIDPSGDWQLAVEDDGCGIGANMPRGTGLGSKIIKVMSSTLKANFAYEGASPGLRALVKKA